jgi:hypothetical protein
MMPLNNPTHIINEVKRLIESERRSEIKLNANGGNSILLACDPMKEVDYIAAIEEQLANERYSIIDLNKSLIDFVDIYKTELEQWYSDLQSNPEQIFKAPAGEESDDLFKRIIEQIQQALQRDKVPVLINTGALYATGIHNIHIMENEMVMKAALPLIILYPATIEPDRIMFLGKQPASKYRCMILH